MILIFTLLVVFVAFSIALARRRTSDAWLDVLTIGGLAIATAGFFWRLLSGQVWMPAGGGDLAQFLYPTYAFAAEWWRRGAAPLWNPYLFGGAPFIGDIQSGVLYPINLITFFLSSPLTFRDMEYLSVLHFFIAGAGMYLFLRLGKWKPVESEPRVGTLVSNPGLSRGASVAGAIAFEFSDLFITHFGNLNLIAVAVWMPLVLLFYRRAVTDKSWQLAATAGIVLGVAFLAGHIQSFLFIVIALVLFMLFHAFVRGWGSRRAPVDDEVEREPQSSGMIGRGSIVLPFLLLLLAAVVAFGLAAPALLPSMEMAQHTVRAGFSYEQAAQYSLPPAQLIGLLVPAFFGRGSQNAWGPWPRVEVGYIGILPIVLALLAVVLRRDSSIWFFGGLALIGLGLALGGYAILHGWLYQFVPGFGQLRAPARFVVLMDFGLAVLAAFGFDALLGPLSHTREMIFRRVIRPLPWIFLLTAVPFGALAYAILVLGQGQDAVLFARIANAVNALAFFILLYALSVALIMLRGSRLFEPRAWMTLALGLIFFDLFSLGAYVDASADDPSHVFDRPDAVAFLKADGDFYRVDPRETGVDNAWPPDTSILYGIFDVNGDNPLVLADFDRYWQSLGSRSARTYDLLNVKYLIGRKNVPLDRAKFRLAFDGESALDIFENKSVLPRVFVVFDVEPVSSHAQALETIRAPDLDLTRKVVLEGSGSFLPSGPAESAAVTIVGYGPNEILVDVNSPRAGLLFLSEIYYPGWRAWEDEREIQVWRANYLFRGVPVSQGAHRIRLLYDPPLFKVGVGLLAVTFVLLGGWSIWKMRR